jgi:hypothetical protein
MVAAYTELVDYIGNSDNVSIFTKGPLLTMLAVFTWTLTMCREFNNVWVFDSAVRLLVGSETNLSFDENDRFNILSLSPGRIAFVILLTVVRFFIGGALWIFGTIYIVYETNLGDLMLNCIALEFIINIDELLYDAGSLYCIMRPQLIMRACMRAC